MTRCLSPPARQHRWHPFSRLVGFTLVGVVATSCSDLKPIADFGKNGAAIAGYSEVSDDYVASLERQKRYGQTGSAVSDSAIATRKKQALRIRERQEALKLYAQALGALAADDLIDYDKQI